MDYRSLGRTGVQVSALCLGCMNFGGRSDEAESVAVINRAVEGGINFFDTANVYGHDPAQGHIGRGRSEEILGRWFQQSGKRQEIILATKAHFAMSQGINKGGSSRRHLIEQCEASLRRLQTEWIDLYQLHHPSNDVPIDETLRALDDLVRAGKVRYIGTSVFAAWQLMEALWVSKELGLNRFVTEQPPYHLLDRRIERELIPMARTYGMAVLAYSPLAAGFLTGKYKRGTTAPEGSRFEVFWRGSLKNHDVDAAHRVLDAVESLAHEKGCTPGQIALAWVMRQPGITSAIAGPRTVEHIEDNLGAAAITLTDADKACLDAVAPPGRATVPYYGEDGLAWVPWGPHEYRW